MLAPSDKSARGAGEQGTQAEIAAFVHVFSRLFGADDDERAQLVKACAPSPLRDAEPEVRQVGLDAAAHSDKVERKASLATGPLPVSGLPKTPRKRRWLHGTELMAGAVTLLVAPGARGKSSWLITLSLACASGKELLGSHIFGGPHSVLYLNAEDSTDEIGLRIRAAMQHHGLSDQDVGGLHVAGVDRLAFSLLTVERGEPKLNEAGWRTLGDALDVVRPAVLVIDPLVSVAGGASLNDNTSAALLMKSLVQLASARGMAIIIAHHSAKYRDTQSADAAMGAASFVNLARICLSLETLNEAEAARVGIPPWDCRSILRLVGTKQNLSPPSVTDRFFRLVSVDANNAEPPIYPNGDRVGVIELFTPNQVSAAFPKPMIDAVLATIGSAKPPLSPSPRSPDSALRAIVGAIAPHRGGGATDADAKAIIEYVVRSGLVAEVDVQVPRHGRGPYTRKGLALTTASLQVAPTNASSHTPSPTAANSPTGVDLAGGDVGAATAATTSGGCGGKLAGWKKP